MKTIKHTLTLNAWDNLDSVEHGQLFLSQSLLDFLRRHDYTHFTVSNSNETMFGTHLNYLAAVKDGGDVIVHYVMPSYPWRGSITICKEKLVALFGGVPSHMTIQRIETDEAPEAV
jgi:hypothetical protein